MHSSSIRWPYSPRIVRPSEGMAAVGVVTEIGMSGNAKHGPCCSEFSHFVVQLQPFHFCPGRFIFPERVGSTSAVSRSRVRLRVGRLDCPLVVGSSGDDARSNSNLRTFIFSVEAAANAGAIGFSGHSCVHGRL